MLRWPHRLLALTVVLVFLTGCVTSQASTTVKKDGSGTNVLVIGFNQQLLDLMGSDQFGGGSSDPLADLTDSMEELAEELPEEWAATVEPWSDAEYQGIQIATEFADLEMLEEQVFELMTDEGAFSGGAGGGMPMFEEFEAQQDGSLVTLRAEANPGAFLAELLAESGGALEEQGLTEDTMGMVLRQMKFTWTVELPNICGFEGEDFGKRTGNRVVWTMPVEEDRTLVLEVQGILAASTQRVETRMNGSGGGTNEVVLAAADDVALTDRLVEDAQKRIKGFPEAWRGRVESWEEGGLRGIKISTAFADLEALKLQLDQLVGSASRSNEQCLGRQLFQKLDARDEDGTIVIAAEVDPAGLSPDTSASWSVELPRVESFEAAGVGSRSGNSVTWTFEKPADDALAIEVRGSRGLNLLMLAIFGLLGLGALSVLVGVVLLVRRSRRPTLAPAGGLPGWASDDRFAGGAPAPYAPSYGEDRQAGATAPLAGGPGESSFSPTGSPAPGGAAWPGRQEPPAEPASPWSYPAPALPRDELPRRPDEPFVPRVYDLPADDSPTQPRPGAQPPSQDAGGASTRVLPESESGTAWDLPLSGSWTNPLGAPEEPGGASTRALPESIWTPPPPIHEEPQGEPTRALPESIWSAPPDEPPDRPAGVDDVSPSALEPAAEASPADDPASPGPSDAPAGGADPTGRDEERG